MVEIYDLTGRLVWRMAQGKIFAAGSHLVTWQGADDAGQPQSSGVYLINDSEVESNYSQLLQAFVPFLYVEPETSKKQGVRMRTLLYTIIILVIGISAQAATFTVNPDGSGDFPTIQAAIFAVNNGDVILLGDGIFTGPGNRDLDTNETNFTLQSQSGDPNLCVIDCQGSESEPHFGIYFQTQNNTAYLSGISIINGYQDPSGGALVMEYASVIIENCIFSQNAAMRHGGAVYSYDVSSPSFINCTFSNNTADYYGEGGAFYANGECSPSFDGCTFDSNDASLGGSLYFEADCYPTVQSSTFWNNSGNNIYVSTDCVLTLDRSILAFNTGRAVYGADNGQANLSCCDVFGNPTGNWVGIISGQGGINNNLEANPLMCHPAYGDFTLHSASPCTEYNNASCGLIGAFPVNCGNIITVAADGSGDYPNIQAAIDAAQSGVDVIVLEDGTYSGPGNHDINFLGKAITLRSLSDNPEACQISAGGNESNPARCFVFENGELSDSVLKGITIKDGWADDGGGIYIDNAASPRIENCHIQNNAASETDGSFGQGGGVFLGWNTNPTFINCDFYDNSFVPSGNFGAGGAIYSEFNSHGLTVVDCRFWNNGTHPDLEIGGSGGAVCMSGGLGTFSNCQFFNNRSQRGGALYCWGSYSSINLFIEGCTFYGNQGETGIIGTGNNSSSINITNTIISNNEAECWFFDHTNNDYNSETIQCSNIFGNTGEDWPDHIADQAGVEGNFSLDPRFCDPAADDLNLEATSPCLPGSAANPSCGLIGALGQGCDFRGLITSVADVPNDQGRRVRVSWNRSAMDSYSSIYPITNYSIWRRIDDPEAKAIVPPADKSNRADKFPSGDWDYLKSVPARFEYQYNVLCETVADSTISGGQHLSTFFVSAETGDPSMFFDSLTASGYSIDNLAPAVPGNFRLESPTRLAWDEISAADFDYFTVYGSFSGLLDGTEDMLGHTISLAMDIPETSYPFYLLTAMDYSGNEGQAAILITGVSGVDNGLNPTRFAFYQAWPNPGTHGTNFSFDLPKASMVNLSVYNVAGRRVSTVVNSVLPAGSHSVAWTGRVDGSSGTLASGVYFYRIEAGEFSDSGRLMILK